MRVWSCFHCLALAGVFVVGGAACSQPVDEPAAVSANASAEPLPQLSLVRAFPKLTFKRPVWISTADDGTNRLFVLEQAGRIMVFENDPEVTEATVFLDLSKGVRRNNNEEGLLAITFDPKFKDNGQFYVYYSASNPVRSVISRFTLASPSANAADPASEEVIMEIPQPYGNHNGATMLFGNDGFLYISVGDGGWANDPHDHGQNLGTLLATILRIDVHNTQGDLKYAIPADNPFVDREGARGEIWAYGLRNVWRMSFDRKTGDLWAGDVGQNAWEEISLITKGGNYGWALMEGTHQFKKGAPVNDDPLIEPVIEYPHRNNDISVTGGYVYRGSKIAALEGVYVYADYVSGRIWGLRYEGGKVTINGELVAASGRRPHITSFGEDQAGELLVVAFDGLDGRGGGDGRIYRLAPR